MLANETAVRLGCFLGILMIMALWECLAPTRQLTVSKPKRWFSNLGIVVINTLVVRFVMPMSLTALALFAERDGWGLLSYATTRPWLAILVSIMVMDCVVYLQHVVFHAVPTLWRLHRVHHADQDFDVTTGSRFHPIEILISLVIKASTILLLGVPALAVVIFEILLNGSAMFNHANISLPSWLDRPLRFLIVTPDMHRVHHSVDDDETNSNFGFNLTWWDRLFGTYKQAPRAGQLGMTVGLRNFRDSRISASLPHMLMIPFVGDITGYTINRRHWSSPDDLPADSVKLANPKDEHE